MKIRKLLRFSFVAAWAGTIMWAMAYVVSGSAFSFLGWGILRPIVFCEMFAILYWVVDALAEAEEQAAIRKDSSSPATPHEPAKQSKPMLYVVSPN